MSETTDSRDGLIGALLRAATWLDEAGHALRLQGSTRVADHLILEGGYARDAALTAMMGQNDENATSPTNQVKP